MIKSHLKNRVILLAVAFLCTTAVAGSRADATGVPMFRASFDNGLDAGSVKAEKSGDVRLTDGVKGKALLVGRKAFLSYPTEGNIHAKSGTMSFWMKPVGWAGSDDQQHCIISAQGNGRMLELITTMSRVMFLGGKYTSNYGPDPSIQDWREDEWRNITLTWDEGKARVYANGIPASAVMTWPSMPTDINGRIQIGGDMGLASDGLIAIDDLRIYKSALSDKDVQNLYLEYLGDSSTQLSVHKYVESQNTPESTNLAKAEYDAFPLSSSTSGDRMMEIENIMDGNYDTRWTSAMGVLGDWSKAKWKSPVSTPNLLTNGEYHTYGERWVAPRAQYPMWVEVRWPQPVSLSRLVVNEDPRCKTAEYKIAAYVDDAWKDIVGPTINIRKLGERIVENFPAVKTTRIRYCILKPSAKGAEGYSSITELQACGTADWVDAVKKIGGMHNATGAKTDDAFTVKLVKTSPIIVKPGSTVRFNLELQAVAPVKSDYGFVLRVGEKVEGAVTYGADYTLTTKPFVAPVDTSDWVLGQKYPVAVDVFIPNYTPHGDISVWIDAVAKNGSAAVNIESDGKVGDTFVQRFAQDTKPWPAVTPKTEVRRENGECKMYVNGKLISPYIMTEGSYLSYQALGGETPYGGHVRRILDLKMVSADYGTPGGDKENEDWFKAFDQQMDILLRLDPDAYVLVCAMMRPSKDWEKNHPDETALLSNGARTGYSLSSRQWMGQLRYDYTNLVKHLMTSKYAGHVIGVTYETCLETQYWGSDDGYNTMYMQRENLVIGDYSPEHIRAFREWLKIRYNNDPKSLQSAWKDDKVTFDTAYPDINILRKEDVANSSFKDPALTRMPLDYWEFHNEQMANMAIYTGQVIKNASGGKYLTGLWGFYSNGMRAATASPGVQHFGYCAFNKVLESPAVDIIIPLRSYAFVRWGTPAFPMNLSQSIRSHGKIELVEYDLRTYLATPVVDMRTYSLQETQAVIDRDTAWSSVRGDALWWVGFANGLKGRVGLPWYADDDLLSTLRRGARVYNAAYRVKTPPTSQIAVFMNSRDVYNLDVMNTPGLLSSAQTIPAYFELTKLGSPVDYFLLDDIALPEMERYKVYIFLNAWNVTDEQREIIKKTVRKAGKTAVWLYAPGYSNGKRLSLDSMKDLTGFNFGADSVSMVPEVKMETGHTLTVNLSGDQMTLRPAPYYDPDHMFGVGPIFYVDDPSAEVVGRYVHNGKAAYAVKKIDEANSIYMGVPCMNSAIARDICRFAGAHLYSQSDVYMDATSKFMVLTARETGYDETVSLPTRSTVYDIYNKRIVARNVTNFHAFVDPLQSRFYFLGTDTEVRLFSKSLK